MTAPALPPHCGSWIIVQLETNTPVRETFDKRVADHVARCMADRFEVLTAADWLARFNKLICEGASR